jgi:hypothetical protein
MTAYPGQSIAFLNVEDVRLTDVYYVWLGWRFNPGLCFGPRLAWVRIIFARGFGTTVIRQVPCWNDLCIGFGPEPLDFPNAVQKDPGFGDCCPPQTPEKAEDMLGQNALSLPLRLQVVQQARMHQLERL